MICYICVKSKKYMFKFHIFIMVSLLLIMSSCWQYNENIQRKQNLWFVRTFCDRIISNSTEDLRMEALRKACNDFFHNNTGIFSIDYS